MDSFERVRRVWEPYHRRYQESARLHEQQEDEHAVRVNGDLRLALRWQPLASEDHVLVAIVPISANEIR